MHDTLQRWTEAGRWEDAQTKYKSEYIHPDALDDLNTCLSAAILLLEEGRTEELDLIDPTGAMSSGECTPLYAALMVSSFANETRGRGTTLKPTNATRKKYIPPVAQKLPSHSAIFKLAKGNRKLYRWGANQIGVTEMEFTDMMVSRYGKKAA